MTGQSSNEDLQIVEIITGTRIVDGRVYVSDQMNLAVSFDTVKRLAIACQHIVENETEESYRALAKEVMKFRSPGMYYQCYPEELEPKLRYNPSQPKEKRKSVVPGWVYLAEARDLGRWKIGRTRQPKQRGQSLQRQSPVPLRIVCTIKSSDTTSLESSLHEKFASKRVHGEWFELSHSDIEYIQSLSE